MSGDPFCQLPTFSREFLDSLLKLLSSSAEDSFDKRNVLSNKEVFFNDFSELQRKVGDFWQKKRQQCQTSVLLAQRNILKKNNVRKEKLFFVFFRLWAKNAGKFHKKILAAFWNWKLHIQGIKFYQNFWCSMTHFVSFRLLVEIFWKVYQNGFLWALRIVLKKYFFFRTKKCSFNEFQIQCKKVLDFWQKNRQECQTSGPLAQRNILKKTKL